MEKTSMALPMGFRFAGQACGIKQDPSRLDLALIVSDAPCAAAGVYTQNRVVAAPVVLDRQRTPAGDVQAVVVNSGNANACTGEQGMMDAQRMTQWTAEALSLREEQVLVMSTGIIGQPLPMEKIARGIQQAAQHLAANDEHQQAAARAIMTTDKAPKYTSRSVSVGDTTYSILGMAKGAGMIGPNMATMLAVIVTDARLDPDQAQFELSQVADVTFNCISVEGHTSTNDTLLLLANGRAGGVALQGDGLGVWRRALHEVCGELARAIPNDGEGSTHLIQIDVDGCASRSDAHAIARAIANSPLVKTAIAGADPNWGRIVSAAGYAGVPFDPQATDLLLNGTLVYQNGQPLAFDAAAVSTSIRTNRQTEIHLKLSEGPGHARFWTSDLTAEYVRINADYHT